MSDSLKPPPLPDFESVFSHSLFSPTVHFSAGTLPVIKTRADSRIRKPGSLYIGHLKTHLRLLRFSRPRTWCWQWWEGRVWLRSPPCSSQPCGGTEVNQEHNLQLPGLAWKKKSLTLHLMSYIFTTVSSWAVLAISPACSNKSNAVYKGVISSWDLFLTQQSACMDV